MNYRPLITLLVLVMLLLVSTGAVAQSPGPSAPQSLLGSGFTYQGLVKNAGIPVNGSCDLQFSLWDTAGSGTPPTGGVQVGATQSLTTVTVANGLFTVILNSGNEFGDTAFTGEARWLQVAVRCPGGGGAYTTLSPRQALTAAPYAHSLTPNATINGLTNTGDLFFGTTTRQMLNLWGTEYAIGVQSYDIYFRADHGAGFAWYTGGTHSNTHYSPGNFGINLMTLDNSSGLTVQNKVSATLNSLPPTAAVSGFNTGSGYGLYGASNTGVGVIGEGGTNGVVGLGSGLNAGVYGENSVGGPGVKGKAAVGPCTINSPEAGIAPGQLQVSDECTGVVGQGDGNLGSGVLGTGLWQGVVGESTYGASLVGIAGQDVRFYVDNQGNVFADGTYNSPAGDFAEMLPAAGKLEPGDVLVIGPDGDLVRSTSANQSSVVGVYSTKPAFVGGRAEGITAANQAPLAIVGVVPVKVSAENGPITPGDLLVTSATPGHAMLAGANPATGTVIGKALGSLNKGTGVIRIIITLQ